MLPPLSPASSVSVPRASPLVRYTLLVYVALVIYGSLFPWRDWRNLGVPAFAFVDAVFPQYWSWREIAANLVAYWPLGLLTVWAMRPWCRGLLALIIAAVASSALSFSIEAAQVFMPGRVSSNVDWYANSLGGLLGAICACVWAIKVVDEGALLKLRLRWFDARASAGLLIIGLWILAQAAPQSLLFATGDLSRWLGDWVNQGLDILDLTGWPTPEQHVHAETAATAAAILVASLFLARQTRASAPRTVLVLMLVLGALGAKWVAYSLLLPSSAANSWLTPGALSGLLLGGLMSMALVHSPSRVLRPLFFAALSVQLLIVNFWPRNIYLRPDTYGVPVADWLHLSALLQTLSCLWPVLALLSMLRRNHSNRVHKA